jgi:hypothetical protein
VNHGLAAIAIASARAQGNWKEAPIMVRLDDALRAVGEALEAALQTAEPKSDGPYVVLGNPAEANAKYGETSKGRFLLTRASLRVGAGRVAPAPAAALEADLLMTADFPGQYLKGLRMMAAALDWVQDDAVLSVGGAPADSGADAPRFTVGFVELGFEEAASLVGMAGVKGCPFALLRLRGLSAGSRAES